ncbi:MAG: hypothetical protein Q8P36_01010 [bacterium]|nr:hypothetical protein [bacterium]
MARDDFDTVPVEITNVVIPRMHLADDIAACFSFNMSSLSTGNPLWKEGEPENEKSIPGNELFQKMLEAGWVTAMIGWTRDDGHVNFGHEPSIHHRLMAVMVKLKANNPRPA